MNFLAHTFLSGNDEDILIGNFIADFVNGSKLDHFPSGIKLGVKLHRGIDQFTDKHKMVKHGVRRLYEEHGKYAPVVIDIVYDHILAVKWDQYSDTSLRLHVDKSYAIFNKKRIYFPNQLKGRINRMIDDDFLFRYRSRSGFERSLNFMDRRTKFPSNFTKASNQLYNEWEEFEHEFDNFMPDIIGFVESFIANQPSK